VYPGRAMSLFALRSSPTKTISQQFFQGGVYVEFEIIGSLHRGVLLLAGLAAAQGGATGAISGTVQDVSGAVVAGAQVQIINQDTGSVARTMKTDANGAFVAPLLPVATYTVKITGASLGEANLKDITVRITETRA